MTLSVLGSITDEMKLDAFFGAIILTDEYKKRYSDDECCNIYFPYIENIFLEALIEGVPFKLIELYMEKLSLECCYLSYHFDRKSSWKKIKQEVNSYLYNNIIINEMSVAIPCKCGVGEYHSFYNKIFFCENGSLVYETVTCNFMNGVYNIKDTFLFNTLFNESRYARPPFRLDEDMNIIPYCIEQNYTFTKTFYLELRENALNSDVFVDTYGDLIPPIWCGNNPNIDEPNTIYDLYMRGGKSTRKRKLVNE